MKKVEFIESYIKHNDSDYQWNDNHGELIRCKDCKHGDLRTRNGVTMVCCDHLYANFSGDWYCADGERRIDDD